jgi:hypothetical protein
MIYWVMGPLLEYRNCAPRCRPQKRSHSSQRSRTNTPLPRTSKWACLPLWCALRRRVKAHDSDLHVMETVDGGAR